MPDVVLKAVEADDLVFFFEHQTDVQANEMAAFGSKHPRDKAAFYSKWQRLMENPEIVCRAVMAETHVAGYIAFFEQLGKPSISYWIGRPFWSMGIATEAVRQFLQVIVERPLYARVALTNLGSVQVLTKNGFKQLAKENSYSEALEKMVEEAVFSLEQDHYV